MSQRPMQPDRSKPGGWITRVLGLALKRLQALSTRRAFLLCFTVAFTLNLLQTCVVRPLFRSWEPLGYDGHVELAQNLAAGNGFVFEPGGHRVFHRPPLYAAVLTPGMMLPRSLHAGYVSALNAAFLAGAGALILILGRSMLPGPSGELAWLAFSFYPLLLYTAKTAIPSLCQTFLFLLIFAATFRAWQALRDGGHLRVWAGIGYGVLLLCGALSHGTMLAHAFLGIGGLSAYGIWKRRLEVFRFTLPALAAFVILLAPWTYRNYQVTGMFLPVVGNSGLAYFSGNAHWGITLPVWQANESRHEAELRHIGLPPERAGELVQFYGFTEVEAEKFANARAKEHMRNHPGEVVKKVALNGVEYYFPAIYYLFPPLGSAPAQWGFPERLKHMEEKSLLLITLLNAGMIALAMRGLWLLKGHARSTALWLAGAWLAFCVPYFPFLTAVNHTLYTFGTLPFIFMLASVGVQPLFGRFTEIHETPAPKAAAVRTLAF